MVGRFFFNSGLVGGVNFSPCITPWPFSNELVFVSFKRNPPKIAYLICLSHVSILLVYSVRFSHAFTISRLINLSSVSAGTSCTINVFVDVSVIKACTNWARFLCLFCYLVALIVNFGFWHQLFKINEQSFLSCRVTILR